MSLLNTPNFEATFDRSRDYLDRLLHFVRRDNQRWNKSDNIPFSRSNDEKTFASASLRVALKTYYSYLTS